LRLWLIARNRHAEGKNVSNTLFIFNDPTYGTERSYNGLRLRIRWSTTTRNRFACS